MDQHHGIEILPRVRMVTLSDGRKIAIHPLTIGDYASFRDEALKHYRRQYIETYVGNADQLPVAERAQWVHDAFAKAQSLTFSDLPTKTQADTLLPFERGESSNGEAKRPIDYALWWVGGTKEGMVFAFWCSLRKDPSQQHISLNDVEKMFLGEDGLTNLNAIANEIGELSNPGLAGNGETPLNAGAEEKKKSRRERRRRRRK